MESAQEIINSIEKIKSPKKKLKKKEKLKEKEYIKKICLEEKKLNPTITSYEVSNKFGIPEKEVEKYFKEDIEISKKSEEEKKNIKPKEEKKFFEKILTKIKKILDEDDKQTIKELSAKIILYGIPLNFALFVIFKIKFNFYSWIGWGIGFWFIEKKFVDILRGIWIR